VSQRKSEAGRPMIVPRAAARASDEPTNPAARLGHFPLLIPALPVPAEEKAHMLETLPSPFVPFRLSPGVHRLMYRGLCSKLRRKDRRAWKPSSNESDELSLNR
jgi:hypothetical protein